MRHSALHGLGRGPLAVWLLAAANACAQDADLTTLPLEQLMSMEVYSASRFNQKTSQAPSNVTVLTSADIRAYGWRTLADALRSIRGVYTSSDRSYSYVGARGFLRPGDLNARFLLQINGTRINDPVFDQALLGGEFPLDLELVDRIEFVPGPGSSVYGANALFGVINVITRRAQDIEGTRATLEAGQGRARGGSASYAWRNADAELVLGANRTLSDGRDLYFPEHGASAIGLDWEHASRFFARGQWEPWSLMLLSGERTKSIPTASFGQPFNVPGSQTLDRLRLVDLGYRNAILPLHGELTARLYHGEYYYEGHYVNQVPFGTINRDITRARWWGTDVSLFMQLGQSHKLVLGADYQYNHDLSQKNFDTEPFEVYLDDKAQGKRLGIYLQDEITLADGVLLNAGLRYDRETSTGGVFNPRLALIAEVAQGTTVKAIYGSAFRAPNSYEMFYGIDGQGGQLANPELGRERIRSHELSLVRRMGTNARFTLSAYSNRASSLITQVEDLDQGLPIFRNFAHATARGVEFEYEHCFTRGASLRASVARQRVSASTNEVNSPHWLAKLNAAARLHGAWHAGLEGQYVSARSLLGRGEAGGYVLANLNLYTIGLTRHFDLALGVSNLFDRRYADPASVAYVQRTIEQDGRRAYFKVKVAY
ncbi:TonB-dependent receptor [Pseudoduganella sp. DS3]|uniref:TonB-dependent receptor n=1 Tax=Pseudoduganella guangdongensis TaxID=2692179 RepID=A0A6N9HQ08_9BURK|nr:TonB-dependent receptor [Pseudoduganella guangdongensis]MYN04892.1 TonB-dependent receptor [Pseudoduganella guangdongensis]